MQNGCNPKIGQLIGASLPQGGPVHGEIVVLPQHDELAPAAEPDFDPEAVELALAHAAATSQVGPERASKFVPGWVRMLGV